MRFTSSQKKEISDYYKTNGFVIITDFFELSEIEVISKEIISFFTYRLKENNSKSNNRELLNTYYKTHKTEWKQAAGRMWDSLSLINAISKPQMVDILKTLGIKAPMIATRPEVRTDMPQDEQYRQLWHQDWRYGQTSLNSITMWVPTHDVDEKDGTIEVIPLTHILGLLKVKEYLNPRRFIIEDEKINIKAHKPLILEMKKGECVFFSQFTLHQSGYNSSGMPRLSFQGRFADAAEENFIQRGYTSLAMTGLELSYEPTEAELKRIFL